MKKYIVRCCLMALAGGQLASMVSCSGMENELETIMNDEATRVTLVEKAITDLEAGTLSTRLTAEEKTSVQRLVLAGTFGAADVDCLQDELPALVELDMEGVRIISTGSTYNGYQDLLADEIGANMFSGMNLQVIKLPSTIKKINNSAFYNCKILSLTIPASVTEIEYAAFQYCPNLKEIEIPSTVKKVYDNLFYGCENLETVRFLADLPDNRLPNSVFYNCQKLKNLTLASNIEEVGYSCFSGCSSLTDYTVFQGIKKIRSNAFSSCGFETIDLSNVTELENDAFSGCKSLSTVVFPQTLKAFPTCLFYQCSSLSHIDWPAQLEEIGSSALAETALTEVEIPASVKTIRSDAFRGTLLKELTIPETVTTVEANIVSSCRNLTAFVWDTKVTPVPYCYGLNPNCLLYIRKGDEASIAVDPSWKNIIMNGVATNIELEYSNNEQYAFHCPEGFKAEKISYKLTFSNYNYMNIGESSNWHTITLPFTPTSITHETKGAMAPFGSTVEDAKPFWLRKLGTEGFENVTTIEPDVPYIIAVPNNPDIYLDEYNLAGDVTFSAENATISATPAEPTVLEGPGYNMYSNYEYKPADVSVYVLNTDYYVNEYNYGSIFIRGILPVHAFEGYVRSNSSTLNSRIIPIGTGSRSSRAVKNTTGIPSVDDM